MTITPTSATPTTGAAGARSALDDFEVLFDTLLFAVSHDLKSPLLSISLGAELLGDPGALDDRTRLAVEAMRRGAADLTRLLDAVTLVSRARRRPLDSAPVALTALLPSVPNAEAVLVAVDPRVVSEFLASLGGVGVEVRAGEGEVRLALPWPADEPACEGPPLEALLAALGLHAGTLVGTLAALQVQLERQGGTIVVGGGHATALLPRA